MIIAFKPATAALPDYVEIAVPETQRDNTGRITTTRKLMCKWADRFTLQAALVGGQQTYLEKGLVGVQTPSLFSLGDVLPDFVPCISATIKGFGEVTGGEGDPGEGRPHIPPGAGAATEEVSIIEATYANDPFFWSETFDLAGDVITCTGGKQDRLYWKSDHSPVDPQVQRPLVFIGKGRWNVVYHALRFIPAEIFDLRKGVVNSTTMLSILLLTDFNSQYEFTPGTALYVGSRIAPGPCVYEMIDGGIGGMLPLYRVEICFDLDSEGHNTKFRPGLVDGGGEAIGDSFSIPDGTGGFKDYNPYRAADLRPLVGQA